jgi:hypothetical protein
MPSAETSATLRVTSVSPCTFAVAAKRTSISGSGSGIPSSAQASVDGQDAVAEPGPHARELSIERSGLARIGAPFQLDPATGLSENEDARPDLSSTGVRATQSQHWAGLGRAYGFRI